MTRSTLNRPFYYGTGMDNTIHAYTRREWGIGGSLPFGNYSVHSVTGLVIVTAMMTFPAISAPVLLLIALIKLNVVVALISLVCTVLFTGGWLLGVMALKNEFAAIKLRRLKNLPKPRFSVTDDQARFWFEKNHGEISITPENFPDSTLHFPAEEICES